MDLLQKLSKSTPILDGAATLHMMPFPTMRGQRIYDSIVTALGDDLPGVLGSFTLLEMYCVGVDLHDDTNRRALALVQWWEDRDSPLPERAEQFEAICAFDLVAIINEAYHDTREELPPASEELQQGRPDPKGTPTPSSDGGESLDETS